MHDIISMCFFCVLVFSEKSLQDHSPGLPANYMNGEIV